MKIRVHGFSLSDDECPNAMRPVDVYAELQEMHSPTIDKKGLIRASATEVVWHHNGQKETWWGGMMVKARDAKSFTKLVNEDGKIILRAEDLKDGKLAEVGFFIANPDNGSGLVAGYHGGPSLGLLSVMLPRLFRRRRDRLKKEKLEVTDNDDQKAEIRKNFAGKIGFRYLVPDHDLKKLLKSFKSVGKIDLEFTTIPTKDLQFTKIERQAIRRKETFYFPPGCVFDNGMVDEFVLSATDPTKIKHATVTGKSSGDLEETISTDADYNKLLFGEKEYDELFGESALELDNWVDNIRKSSVVDWLLKLTNSATTRLLLTT